MYSGFSETRSQTYADDTEKLFFSDPDFDSDISLISCCSSISRHFITPGIASDSLLNNSDDTAIRRVLEIIFINTRCGVNPFRSAVYR